MSHQLTLDLAHAAFAASLACKAHVAGDAPEDHEDNTFGLPNGDPLRKKLRRFFREQLQKLVGFVGKIGAEIPPTFPRMTDYSDAMASAMTPILGLYWDKAGKALRGRLGLDPDEWRVTDPNIHRAIAAQSFKFCHATNKTSDLEIGKAVELLRKRLAEGLIGEGRTIPELTEAVGSIFKRASKSRAETIARSETSRAVHAAAEMSAEASGVVTAKRWLLSANSCPLCVALAQRVPQAPLGGSFGAIGHNSDYSNVRFPPAHPNCRCSITFVLAEDGTHPKPAPVPAFVPKPAPAPKPAKVDPFPDDPDNLQVVRKLGGSTGAELVRDDLDRLFVRKRGASPGHLREEVAADAAYRALGVDVPDSKLYDTKAGPVKLAKFVEGQSLAEVRKSNPALAAKAEGAIRKGFAADALLGNWDVIGLSGDNVLVDPSGKPWRVDNGGSLRYRAQGGKKTAEQWNANPLELWTMRDPKANAQAASAFGSLGFDDVAAQVDELAKKAKALKLPADVAGTVKGRLDQMKDLVKVGRSLRDDKFVEGYADDFCRHTSGIRAAGISGRMPAKLTRKAKGSVEVLDENGKPFDHLRGKGSLVEGLADYIAKSGGNYDAARYWMQAQAGSSWSSLAKGLKYHLATQRGGDFGEYYWQGGHQSSKAALDDAIKAAGGELKYREAMTSLHAFTREYLSRADFPGKDARKGTIKLMRTENAAVMQAAGLQRGDQDVKLKRGVAESTSIYRKVRVHGSEETVQEVPIHRIVATYWQERAPGQGNSAFLGDHENEFLAILDDVPFTYKK